MAFGNNFTSYDALLKEYYSDDAVTNEIFRDNPFLAMVPKFENSIGRHFVHPVVYSAGQGRSATFTQAQGLAGLTGELSVDFLVSRVENHEVANVSSQTIAASGGDRGAFMKAVTLIADNQLQNLANDLSLGLYGGTDGNRGQISQSTTIAGSVISFANPKDVLKFEVGMELDLAATQSSGGVKAYGSNGHGLYVVKVDFAGCTITVGALPQPGATPVNINDSADGIPLAAHGDFIYVRGDRNSKLSGFQAWIPYGGPSSSPFFGVDRTVQPVRLAGNWLDGTGGTLEEVLEQAAANVNEVGGNLSHYFMSFKKFADLSKSLGAKAQLVDVKVNADVGFKGIEVIGTRGSIVCLPDRSCPANTIVGINLKDWQLNSVGKAAHVWDEDGKVWLRSPSDSGMEIRFYSLGQVVCKKPVSQINIKVNP